jgi:hypothetical protein
LFFDELSGNRLQLFRNFNKLLEKDEKTDEKMPELPERIS